MSGLSATLWRKLKDDMRAALKSLVRTQRAVTAPAGQVTIEGYNPQNPDQRTVNKIAQRAVRPGDTVIVLNLNGAEVVLGPVAVPGEAESDDLYLPWYGDDGDALRIGPGTTASGSLALAVGRSANAKQYNLAIGTGAKAEGTGGETAIGNAARTTGFRSIAVGESALASGEYGVAIGQNTSATHANSGAIGGGAESVAERWLTLGYRAITLDGYGQSVIRLEDADGDAHDLSLNASGQLTIGGTPIGGGGGIPAFNKSINPGDVLNQRVAPSASAQLISAVAGGTQLYDTGYRKNADGFTWCYVFTNGTGWGWVIDGFFA